MKTKIGFLNLILLNAGQYFRPSLSYHLSLRSLFCLFLSGRLRPVLLYCLYEPAHEILALTTFSGNEGSEPGQICSLPIAFAARILKESV